MIRWMLVAALALATPQVRAADLDSLLPEAEVFRTTRDGSYLVEDRWHFNADGTYTGINQLSRNIGVGGVHTQDVRVAGRWSVDGDTLCVTGPALLEGDRACMSVRPATGSTSASQYRATSQGSGTAWDLFIYPADQ